MSQRLKHLIKRQHHLQSQAQSQRDALSENLTGWHGRLRWLDRGLAMAGFVRRHPTAILGAGALVAMLNRSGKTFLGAWAALKAVRKLVGLLAKD
jgi:hypothetical protein